MPEKFTLVCRRYEPGYGACAFCGKPGNKLCDYPLSAGKTCDARMCDDHATIIGQNKDYCPIHKGKVTTPMGDIPAEVTPQIQALVTQAETMALTVSQFQIATASDYQAADGALRNLKSQEKMVKDQLTFLKAPHKEGIARLDGFFKPLLDKIAESKRECDRAMTGWRAEQQRLAREEQKRQEEIAARERARLEAEAAKERAAAEAKERELLERARAAEEAGRAGQAAKLKAQAQAKIDAAETKAADLENVAASVPAPIVQAQIPKIPGTFGRQKPWRAREKPSSVDHPTANRKLTSLEVLILSVADAIAMGQPWPEVNFLLPNQKALDKRATDLREDFNIPGYEAYCPGETTVSR